jgi:hypothetical protein
MGGGPQAVHPPDFILFGCLEGLTAKAVPTRSGGCGAAKRAGELALSRACRVAALREAHGWRGGVVECRFPLMEINYPLVTASPDDL